MEFLLILPSLGDKEDVKLNKDVVLLDSEVHP